jgi:hypothetical protein
MSKLNISLEYLPATKELKNLSASGKSSNWIEQSGQDFFGNPRFQLSNDTNCTIQISKNGKWYVAFVRVSEREDGEYKNSYYKAFTSKKTEEYEENNDPIYFEEFNEWMKDEDTGRWFQKN